MPLSQTATRRTISNAKFSDYWIHSECPYPMVQSYLVACGGSNLCRPFCHCLNFPEFSIPKRTLSFTLPSTLSLDDCDVYGSDLVPGDTMSVSSASRSAVLTSQSPSCADAMAVDIGKEQHIFPMPITSLPSARSSDSRRSICRLCGDCFTRRSNCAEHEKKHDPFQKRLFSCDVCRKRFGRRGDLRRHTRTVSLGAELWLFSCENN